MSIEDSIDEIKKMVSETRQIIMATLTYAQIARLHKDGVLTEEMLSEQIAKESTSHDFEIAYDGAIVGKDRKTPYPHYAYPNTRIVNFIDILNLHGADIKMRATIYPEPILTEKTLVNK